MCFPHHFDSVYAPEKECLSRLECFHSKDYLNALLSSPGALTLKELEEFGLVDDAALFPGLESYLKYLCGTIDAIGRALDDGFRYVINWDGGRHHAQSSSASGYCYINGNDTCVCACGKGKDPIKHIILV